MANGADLIWVERGRGIRRNRDRIGDRINAAVGTDTHRRRDERPLIITKEYEYILQAFRLAGIGDFDGQVGGRWAITRLRLDVRVDHEVRRIADFNRQHTVHREELPRLERF